MSRCCLARFMAKCSAKPWMTGKPLLQRTLTDVGEAFELGLENRIRSVADAPETTHTNAATTPLQCGLLEPPRVKGRPLGSGRPQCGKGYDDSRHCRHGCRACGICRPRALGRRQHRPGRFMYSRPGLMRCCQRGEAVPVRTDADAAGGGDRHAVGPRGGNGDLARAAGDHHGQPERLGAHRARHGARATAAAGRRAAVVSAGCRPTC